MDFAQLDSPKKPSAWLDLDALDHNIKLVNEKTKAVHLRLATKSIRSIDVLKYIIDKSPNYIGLMSYAADESAYLLENGFDNILCAYPTLDTQSIAKTFEYTKQGATMVWMVDRPEQVDVLNQIAKSQNQTVEICLDINMSMPLPKLYFGTKRSALIKKRDVKKLLKHIKSCRHVKLVALMGYEAQIAGLPEHLPGKTMLSPAIKMLKNRSQKQVSTRRGSLVSWLIKQGVDLKIVNGGGSGSMDFTSSQPEVTEITVGSAYYKPAYFDYMDSMADFKPAAGFALPITRRPEKHVITCHGGGFIASGAVGIDKAPIVHYPQGLSILPDEGYGEVQTPLVVDSKIIKNGMMPQIGDAVWCRHAKAGELCEHFNELVCYRANAQLTAEGAAYTMTTYRGEGQCFH
ncbi:alanine racemase [Psychrobacter lutiphocae]|uniref:alanine racemase n=1 Tax=Psychrobacter lutiphocae TaxID=540500 RepID=UPI0003685659|nr:alanine racemase [Psychrobacter lutiphocae]